MTKRSVRSSVCRNCGWTYDGIALLSLAAIFGAKGSCETMHICRSTGEAHDFRVIPPKRRSRKRD